MNILRRLVLGGGIASVLLLSHAGNGGGGGGIGGSGLMRTFLTDAPACGFDAVHVTVDRLRVNPQGQAGPGDGGWTEIVLSPPKRIDLLTLQNGTLEPLGDAELPAGRYRQIRLVLATNSQTQPLANAVTPTGQAEVPLDTAAAEQGIRVPLEATVVAGQAVDVVLDFDACRSVVRAGQSGYRLKPVIKAMPLGPAGQEVVGHVDPTLPMASTRVSLQSAGEEVKATTPDATGQFTLYPVPAGRYDLVISAAGRATVVVRGVPVDDHASTHLNSQGDPLVPVALQQGSRALAGHVNPTSATVRVLQALSGGTSVEVVHAPVDAEVGRYMAELPIDAPWHSTYGPGSLVLQADHAVTGQYLVEARERNRRQAQGIDARQPLPPVDFRFR